MSWPSWRLQPCGTPAACQRHYRRGEKPDRACLEANAAYQRRTTRGTGYYRHRHARRAEAEQAALIREAVRVLADALGVYPAGRP